MAYSLAMARRTGYASILLAFQLAAFGARLMAQDSLGDIARRIRSGKSDGTSSTATAPSTNAASMKADLNATTAMLSERDEAAYSTLVRTQLEQKRFKVLDDVAAAERTGRTRFVGGNWKLHAFYSAIESPQGKAPVTEAKWADFLDQMKQWTAQQPNSVTAQISLAHAYLNYAWQARGRGNTASVTLEGKRLFDERVKLAEDVLNQAAVGGVKGPEWFYVMLQVGRAKGWEVEDMMALFQRAIPYEPEFYYYYQELALNLMPKWRGKDGDAEKFAEESANRMGGKAGDILYWQIAQSILSDRDLGNATPQFVWSRALLGYQSLVEQYGASPQRQNQLAQMAARFGDYMMADETITQIGDRWDEGTWGTTEYFEKVKSWARNSAVPFRKIMEAYKAVTANMATPEGQKYDSVIAREFSSRYARTVKECAAGASGPAPTLLVLQMGKSGAVQQLMVVPDNASDACLRLKLEKAAFSPPPKPEYWIRVALSAKP
jgi:hypothetical protein